MDNNFNKAADDFFSSPAGMKLSAKKDELEKLIDSPEGRTVKNMLSGSEESLKEAVGKGDMTALKGALSSILKTEEGARLAEQIMKMMK